MHTNLGKRPRNGIRKTIAFCGTQPNPRGQLLLDGTIGRIGRMGPMVMGQWEEGTILWGTMGRGDGTTHPALRTTHYALFLDRVYVLWH